MRVSVCCRNQDWAASHAPGLPSQTQSWVDWDQLPGTAWADNGRTCTKGVSIRVVPSPFANRLSTLLLRGVRVIKTLNVAVDESWAKAASAF